MALRSAQLPATEASSILIMAATKSRPSPNATASRILGIELQFVLNVFGERTSARCGGGRRPWRRVDDLELAVRIEEASVARLDVAVVRHRLARLIVLAEVTHAEDIPGDLRLHLLRSRRCATPACSRRGRPDIARRNWNGAIALGGHEQESLRLAVELLQIEAITGTVEGEEVGADRFARGVGDANARESERVP